MAPKKNARGHKMKEAKAQLASKNGKKPEVAGGSSFFTWFMVLALLGVWTSVAVVYFDLVDYQGVIANAKDLHIKLSETLQGQLSSYDADGDGDFDVEDAKVLLDEPRPDRKRARHRANLIEPESPKTKVKKKEAATETKDENPGHVSKRKAKKENPLTKDVGWKLREALNQQLAIIHERMEAKKIAKMALAEVRNILAREKEKVLGVTRDEVAKKAKVATAARMENKPEKGEFKKALGKIRRGKEQKEKEGENKKEEKEGENKKEEHRKKAKKNATKPDKKSGKEVKGKRVEVPKDAKNRESPKAAAKKLKMSDKGVRK
ncbi:aspartyl/asparaginyl beta-hydroxylase isoform X2 [Salvelinus fontinalis]|uniref:aspartyl/asparaginyl beta-hydroxylase isoform X2 n=1 Tax=Salvelinus fontinalis TaxID=8038 RepID=UPI002485BDF6|nr:aspartyl/asparaginyl beta-hydroxylase isoform X2 [Salvelinus fontinalis]